MKIATTTRVRLILDVDFNLNGVTTEHVISNLRAMVERGIGEGMVTRGEAELEQYSMTTQVVGELLSEDELLVFMQQRIENGELRADDVALRLARYGLMDHRLPDDDEAGFGDQDEAHSVDLKDGATVDINDRIRRATLAAQDAFWGTFARNFPEVKTGDASPEQALLFDCACDSATTAWIASNYPTKHDTAEVNPVGPVNGSATPQSMWSGVNQYFDCSTAHLSRKTMDFLETGDKTGLPMAIASYDNGVFVSVPPKDFDGPMPDDLRNVQKHARSLGCLVIRFDADADIHDVLPWYEWENGDQLVPALLHTQSK